MATCILQQILLKYKFGMISYFLIYCLNFILFLQQHKDRVDQDPLTDHTTYSKALITNTEAYPTSLKDKQQGVGRRMST